MAPVTLTIARPRVELTAKGLRGQFNAMSLAETSEKIKTAELFVGLLKEQQAMAAQGVLYKFKFAEWMPALLKTSLTHDSGLLLYPGPDAVGGKGPYPGRHGPIAPGHRSDQGGGPESGGHTHWPVRLMALYLLALDADGGFGQVLEWTSKYDVHPLVRDMTAALIGGAVEPPLKGAHPAGASPMAAVTQ